MKRVILTVGLPRSGKSTWSQQQGSPVVNPDSIRLALHGKAFIPEAEDFVWATAYVMGRALLTAGHEEIIIDATNLTKKRREVWERKFKDCEIELQIFDTAKEVCIQRAVDTGKEFLIPVIERMAGTMEV